MDGTLVARLEAIAAVRRDEVLARHTTFGIGGPADLFVTVRSADQLRDAFLSVREAGVPCFVLGAGSNILVGDAGVRGVVIDNQAKAHRIAPLVIGTDSPVSLPPSVESPDGASVVWAESGASFAALARSLARDGYAGVEWACGVPGTLGGAVIYNAGAYDGCLADVLLAVTLIDGAGDQRYLPAPELKLGYRTSALLRGELGDCVVLTVEIAVTRGDARALAAQVAAFDRQRLDAQPRGRNSGSTFKNPEGRRAWELIDDAGLRGHRIGGARISPKHCNFIENLGDARAADVFALMSEAKRRVRERFGIELEDEVQRVGEGF
ncbi:MAG: UDP-N-acetylmuramate dehydrogenase [Dehalococcoidia bacterium]